MASPAASSSSNSTFKFVAVCPFCRKTKFRAPMTMYADFVECKACKQYFILVPEDPSTVPPDLLAAAQAKAKGNSPHELKYVPPAPPPAPETTPDLNMERTAAAPPVAPPIAPVVPVELGGPPEHANVPLRFALVGLILFGAGILVTQVPYGRIAAVVLGAVGLIVAGLSLLGLEKRKWLGWAGVGLNAVGLLLVIAFPDWLGGPTWTPPKPDDDGPATATAVSRGGARQPADWVDPSNAVWEFRDVRVELLSATVGLSDLDPKDRNRKREQVLRIVVRLTNIGAARAIEFAGWGATPQAPAAGGPLAAVSPAPTGGIVRVLPGKSADATLTYPAPAGPPGNLRLELPAAAFGGTDPVRFEIPGSMIRRNPTGRPAAGAP